MKGLSKEKLIDIIETKNWDVYLEKHLNTILEVFGDDYFFNNEVGDFELTNKNNAWEISNKEDKMNDVMIRASNKAELTREELFDVFTDYGLMGVYTLGQKNMYEYLNGNNNE